MAEAEISTLRERFEAALAAMEGVAALARLDPAEDAAALALMSKRVADRACAEFVAAASRPDALPMDRLFDSEDTPLAVKVAILQADAGLGADEALARIAAAKATATLDELRRAD